MYDLWNDNGKCPPEMMAETTVALTAPETCDDGILNQDEDRIDCGGVCPPCDCLSDLECDDGAYCTGTETCDAYGHCQPGTAVDCNDGVGCTDDSCNEGTDSCDNVPNDANCDNGLYCDGAEWCDAVSDCQAGSDPCPGQSCDEDGDQCLDLCDALASFSCRDHAAAGRLCLDLGTNGGIDPRSGGIDELEIDLTDAVSFAGGVSVTCVNAGDVSARVSGTSVDGNTVTVSFSPALPDQDACTVELDCGASVCLRGLEGDLNLGGETNTTDASSVKLRFGQDAATAGPQWDFDCSGEVNTTDSSQIKLRFGNTAPACP